MAIHSSILAWEIPQRSLAGYSPLGLQRVDMTERLSMHAWISIPLSFLSKTYQATRA